MHVSKYYESKKIDSVLVLYKLHQIPIQILKYLKT